MDECMLPSRKRVIFIGRTLAGKSTLCQYLTNRELKYRKTQTVEIVSSRMIDTPGEFLERTSRRGALLVTAADADYIILVQDATEGTTMFPPGYASSFAKPCIGVVTKADAADERRIADAKQYLRNAGANPVFVTSSYEGTGFTEFLDYFEQLRDEEDS